MNDSSIYNFAGYQVTDRDLQSHVAVIGATGSGKSVTLRLLMQTILPPIGDGTGKRALVYDAKGDAIPVLSSFCDPSRIFTLHPFDERGLAWDIASDVSEFRIAIEVAFALISSEKDSQPFFANAAREIVANIMTSFMCSELDWTFADLMRACSDTKIARRILLRHPETSSVVNAYMNDPKIQGDIFSTISTQLLPFQPIAYSWEGAAESISLRAFMESESILILGNDEISRVPIDAINQTLFKLFSHLCLSKPEYTSERTYIFIDELSEARKLPGFVSLAKKVRSKGGRIAVGFQTYPGLRATDLYGPEGADDLLGNFGNRFIGRLEDPTTAEFVSRIFGEQEIMQESQTKSSGTNPSSSTSSSPAIRKTVLPSELMNIPPCGDANGLEGFVTIRSSGLHRVSIRPEVLFDSMLIQHDPTVPGFIPRNSKLQLPRPWTEDELKHYAPEPIPTDKQTVMQRRPKKKATSSPDF